MLKTEDCCENKDPLKNEDLENEDPTENQIMLLLFLYGCKMDMWLAYARVFSCPPYA